MIPRYILDYTEECPPLREENEIDKTLVPHAERYIALSDIAPHIRYILDHEYYEMDYDSHLQALFSLIGE